MADQAILTILFTRLLSLAEDEIVLLFGTRDRVRDCQEKLQFMHLFLDEADSLPKDEMLCLFIGKTREAAADIEDAVTVYLDSGICNLFKRDQLHRLIDRVFSMLDNLSVNFQTYRLPEFAMTQNKLLSEEGKDRKTMGHLIAGDTVGFENNVLELVDRLTKPEHCHQVLAISGIGGSGKTTLARLVYHHLKVRAHFHSFSWVFISRQLQEPKAVWKKILIDLSNPNSAGREEIAGLHEHELASRLYTLLAEKKCLVVVDDIWTVKAMKQLQNGIQLKSSSSKILVTTRLNNVASSTIANTFTYQLGHLDGDASWKLFQRRALLRECKETDRKMMEKWGKEMVEHCAGLPFAINLLGGILSQKHTVQEWNNFRHNVKDAICRGGIGQQDLNIRGVLWLLSLSYYELPSCLRPCFLFLAQFPRGSKIRVKELCLMWIAENFIPATDSREEDVAYEFFSMLVQRYMVEIEEIGSTGKFKTCYIHDLVREFCLYQAHRENFLKIDHMRNASEAPNQKVRRLSLYLNKYTSAENWDKLKQCYANESGLRSFMCFDEDNNQLYDPKKLQQLFHHSPLLRVLRFQSVRGLMTKVCGKFIEKLGNLTHLRLLSLRDTYIKTLPTSIGNLRCLQILDLRTDWPVEVRNNLGNLEQLRHLYLPHSLTVKGSASLRLSNLQKLQTLVNISTKVCSFNELVLLTELRKLTVFVDAEFRNQMPANSRFEKMESLAIKSKDFVNDIDVTPIISMCPSICKLYLAWPIRRLPEDNLLYQSLVKLSLNKLALTSKQVLMLGKLGLLAILNLTDVSFEKGVMCFSRKHFRRMKSLRLVRLENIEQWMVEEGACATLCQLHIESCRSLRQVPDELRNITTLKEVVIKDMPTNFNASVPQPLLVRS